MIKELEDFENYLCKRETEVMFDSNCGKPVMWGYKIVNVMPDELFSKLKKLKSVSIEYIRSYPEQNVVVTRKLTREDAIEKYGEITDEEYGPRGGWKSVTFGKTKFISKVLK